MQIFEYCSVRSNMYILIYMPRIDMYNIHIYVKSL